jgi:hypothetical protein
VAVLSRAAVCAALAGCYPSVVDDAYNCGPQESCPPNQACDPATTICVAPGKTAAFACDPAVLHEPDGTPAQAFDAGVISCVQEENLVAGCLAAGDAANWLRFTTDDETDCFSANTLSISVSYPLAFEPVELVVTDAGGNSVGSAAGCTTGAAGQTAVCIAFTEAAGSAYLVGLLAGTPTCDGACAFSDYTVAAAIVSP